MHSLVFWEQSKSVSVESNSEIVSSTGKETRLQWGSKTNPARILTQSDNKAWLESLCVNDEGIITGQIAEVPQCNEIEPSNEPPNQSNGSETAESAFADVLLMPGTDVRICPIALNNIRQERAKPSKMATALIKAIIGKERLRTMSVNDPRYSPIPESVMRTVERFVFQEFPGSAMTTRAFKRSITQLCTNLRARNIRSMPVAISTEIQNSNGAMSQHGAALQTYNQELVKWLEEIKARRNELQTQIDLQKEEKNNLQREIDKLAHELTRVSESLDKKISIRNEYDKTIADTEASYVKILESSQILLSMLKKEATTLDQTLNKASTVKDSSQ